MTVLGIIRRFVLGNTLKTKFLTHILRGVEDWHKYLFHICKNREKKTTKKKTNEKQANVVLQVSPKMSLCNNCPMLNVYKIVPRVRRINKYLLTEMVYSIIFPKIVFKINKFIKFKHYTFYRF